MTDDKSRTTTQPELGLPQIVGGKRDAARRWLIAVLRDVKENGAAPSQDAGTTIVVDDSDEIIEIVFPPKRFRPEPKRQADPAVVTSALRVVAPAIRS